MIKIKKVPSKYTFKVGNSVEVHGTLYNGLATVIAAYYPTKQPAGELAYWCQYEEPFPQIGIITPGGAKNTLQRRRSLGGQNQKECLHSSAPCAIEGILDAIIVQVDYDGERGAKESLAKYLSPHEKAILRPLMQHSCYWPSETQFHLDEFDVAQVEIMSVATGSAMRNDGVHAFSVFINIGEDAVHRMEIHTSELL